MNDAQRKRLKKLQTQAVKNFKPITITYTFTRCPDCYGTRPQSNESAWDKGCKQCELFDACGRMTYLVYEASLSKTEWEKNAERAKKYMNPAAWEKRYGKGWTGKLPT